MPRSFSGRETELGAIADAVGDGARVCYVHGPGGVGKTALIGAACEALRAKGVTIAKIDGRDVECIPSALSRELAALLGESGGDALALLGARREPLVLAVDSYEQLAGLDRWLRDELVPALSDRVTLVLAGRNAPSPEWRGHPAWNDSLRSLPLGNLGEDAARRVLAARGVPEGHHARALALTHGHPLAVCLVADVLLRKNSALKELGDAPDVVQALLARFVEELDDDRKRAALEVACLVNNTTEPLLAALTSREDAHSLVRWLASLSFIELGPHGLFPHALARDVLLSDLKWRNPDRAAELLERASAFYAARLQESRGGDPFHLASELLFLHSNHPVVAAFTPWRGAAELSVEAARPGDAEALVAMVARHEGRASAAIARRWLAKQPRAAMVVRDSSATPAGFVLALRLDRARPEDLAGDAAAQLAWRHMEANGHRRGYAALLIRFLMSRDGHQAHSPIMSILGSQAMRLYLTTPDLDWAFTCMAEPEQWKDALEAAFGAELLPPIEIEGRRLGVFVQSFRRQSVHAWLAWLARRGVAGSTAEPRRARSLDRREMEDAVKDALRSLQRPHALEGNALLDSSLIASAADRHTALRELIQRSARSLEAQPRGDKLRAALEHTFFQPATSQRDAAERAGMPFGTYRRHLSRAIDEIVEDLLHRQRAAG